MNKAERVKASEAIDRMLRTFSAARYEADILVTFVTDCDEYSLQAVLDACVAFRTGLVDGFNGAFPPSGNQFISEVRRRDRQLEYEAIMARTEFVAVDSPLWRALCERRPTKGAPIVERTGGASGWYFPKDEVASVLPQRIEYHRAILEKREERQIAVSLPRMGE